MKNKTSVYLSIVLPVFNEEQNLEQVDREIHEAVSALELDYEVIYVDDGSTDSSYERLAALQADNDRLVVVRFRRNFGQTAAMAAGFDIARGDVIVTMDADGQNDPRDIGELLKKINEGYDLVCGWRYQRKDRFLGRRLPSIIANRIISFTTDVKLHDYGCTLKAFRKEVVRHVALYGEMHRFIPAIASWMGVRIAEVKVHHRPRTLGVSKYGISRTFRVILDLITVKYLLSYSSRPLQFFGFFGLISGGFGSIMLLYLIIQRFFLDVPLANRPALLLAVLLIFAGLQFITMGLLAEMQTRTYHETQDKRVYVIKDILRSE